MSLESTLKRVARVQQKKNLASKRRREKQLNEIAVAKSIFEQTEILSIWEDVKEIEVANFATEHVAGTVVKLKELKVPWSKNNTLGIGLELFDKEGHHANWFCEYNSDNHMCSYVAAGRRMSFHENRVTTDKQSKAAENFTETFVKWLAQRIPAKTLCDLGVDFDALEEVEKPGVLQENNRPKRKVLPV